MRVTPRHQRQRLRPPQANRGLIGGRPKSRIVINDYGTLIRRINARCVVHTAHRVAKTPGRVRAAGGRHCGRGRCGGRWSCSWPCSRWRAWHRRPGPRRPARPGWPPSRHATWPCTGRRPGPAPGSPGRCSRGSARWNRATAGPTRAACTRARTARAPRGRCSSSRPRSPNTPSGPTRPPGSPPTIPRTRSTPPPGCCAPTAWPAGRRRGSARRSSPTTMPAGTSGTCWPSPPGTPRPPGPVIRPGSTRPAGSIDRADSTSRKSTILHIEPIKRAGMVGLMVLAQRKVLLLAADDFEDMELLYPLYRLAEEDVEVTVAGLDDHPVRGKKGHGPVPVDTTVTQVAEGDFDALVIPGGYAPDKLRRSETVLDLVRAFDDAKKPIAFICHAGWVPISARIIKGRRATSVGAIRDDMVNAGADWVDEATVVDGNLISARTPADLGPWMKALLKALG